MPALLPVLLSEVLQSRGFAHGFSLRAAAEGQEFDFALDRDPIRLRKNVRLLADAVGVDPARLYQAKQVHGSRVVKAGGDPVWMLTREADALIGANPGDAVGVRVADCAPVLIADPAVGHVVAVHAGWRGVVAGVVGAAIRGLGGSRSGLVAAIGPCIGPCCFEVSGDVAEEIARATTDAVISRRDPTRSKAYVDLRRAVRAQLLGLGFNDRLVEDVPGREASGCTRCNASHFHSYRRDGEASGRLIAVIAAR